MRSARIALVTALAATGILVASPAQARHYCGLEDPTLNSICESHGTDLPLIQKLICLISPTC
jgi:hypothetical protein